MARLKALLKKYDVTQSELARLLKRDRAVITNLMQGKRSLKAQEAITIADFLGVPVTELLGVETDGGHFAEPQMIPFHHAPSVLTRGTRHVVKKKNMYYLEVDVPSTPKTFALEVRDDSLNLSGFLRGDIVIAEMDKKMREGDVVVVQHYDESGDSAHSILRRYLPPMLLPHSTNPSFLPAKVSDKSLRVVAPVVKLLRFF